MKKTLSILFLFIAIQGSAQELTTQDSITVFYDSLIHELETRYLYKEDVDWSATKHIREKALKAESFGESLSLSTSLFDTINGSHLNLFSDYGWYHWSKGEEFTQEQFHEEFLLKYEESPGFEVKVIDEKYGYILMPSIMMLDIPQDSVNLETQKMYDEILETVNSQKIDGWIIDLRFNGGGNIFPMLAALYHFLGETTYFTTLGIDHTVQSMVTMHAGVIHDT
ncbi:MAG: hypothetical protein HRT74_11730, partial [Flavobacteriales bacterium]|nr:hypothetical protein [Flavobacteriales bacterium]